MEDPIAKVGNQVPPITSKQSEPQPQPIPEPQPVQQPIVQEEVQEPVQETELSENDLVKKYKNAGEYNLADLRIKADGFNEIIAQLQTQNNLLQVHNQLLQQQNMLISKE